MARLVTHDMADRLGWSHVPWLTGRVGHAWHSCPAPLPPLLYAAGCAGDSLPNFTAAASDYCLQLLMALATQPSPSLPLNERSPALHN